jgi:epsin
VDFFANPIEQNQLQTQPTGYMTNAYTGFQQQPTGYSNGYQNGFGMQQPNMADPYGQQNLQSFQQQPTGFNPYAQQQQQPLHSPIQQDLGMQPGSNNPWATNNPAQSAIKPMPTGSNNPFASSINSRPQPATMSSMPTFGNLPSLPEQKTLSTFSQPQPSFVAPQKELSEHEAKLNALLASGDGMDTFGNTGQTRIPAQHTAPGTFVNSAGAGLSRLTSDATGSNPFLRTQFTGLPTVSYGGQQMPAATGPAGMSNNPFAASRPQQQSHQSQDLIQF